MTAWDVLRRFLPCALVALSLAWPVAAAEQEQERLETIERDLEQTRARQDALRDREAALAKEVKQLRRNLVAAAQAALEREAIVNILEEQLRDLRIEADDRAAALDIRREELEGTLSALYGLSRNPPQAFFLYPGTPLESVRSMILLREAVPALHKEARSLKIELATLTSVQRDLEDKLVRLQEAETDLARDRKALARLIEQKAALRRQTAAEADRVRRTLQTLSQESRSLRELVAKLRDQPIAPPPPDVETAPLAMRPEGLRAFPEGGPLTRPATGEIVQRYGQDTGFGQTSKGVVLETRGQAPVIAPFDGKIVFAGPFRDHGQILIIEHSGGYHTLLAGLEEINTVMGQWVLAGEPVGTMRPRPSANESQEGLVSGRPRLYIELRRNGQPVNPVRWIGSRNSKVQG